MASRKLLFISEAFYPYVGGAEISAFIVLSRLAQYGLEVSVLTHRFSGTKSQEFRDNLRINRERLFSERPLDFLRRSIFYFKSFLVILRYVLKNRPDVILAQQLTSVPAIWVSRFFRIPVAVIVHDYWPICYYRTLLKPSGQICSSYDTCFGEIYACAKTGGFFFFQKPRLFEPLLASILSPLIFVHTLIVRKTLKSANAIITVSHFLRKTLMLNGFDPRKIQVIYNPVIIKNQVDITVKNQVDTTDLPTLLYVGRLDLEKGVQFLLKAMQQVYMNFGEARLIIVGTGPKKEYFQSLAKSLRIEHCTKFLGRVSDDLLMHLYRSSDVVVVPSIWAEPFGRVIVEAMMCGKPVVASYVGAVPELACHDAGVLVPPGDARALAEAIISLITNKVAINPDPSIHQRFSPDEIATRVLNVLKTCTNKNHMNDVRDFDKD